MLEMAVLLIMKIRGIEIMVFFLVGTCTASNMKVSTWIHLKQVTLMMSPGVRLELYHLLGCVALGKSFTLSDP